MKRPLSLALLIALAAAAYAPLPSMARTDFSIVVSSAPPAPMYERMPAPRPGYVWAPGHWEWRGQRHYWTPGVWIVERPGYVYAPAAWYQRDDGWYMEPAHWTPYAGRDRDRDGIPDRMESHMWREQAWREHEWRERHADRDRDGVPNRYDRDPNNPWRY
jgi:hypothetical protein